MPTTWQIVEAYVKARLAFVEPTLRGDVEEDDLEVPDRIEEQLEQLPVLCRYVYVSGRVLPAVVRDAVDLVWIPRCFVSTVPPLIFCQPVP